MCDDFISAARYIGAGTVVNRGTISTDTIEQVGPSGHYLGEEHTMKHFRSEIWSPTVFNRTMYETWEKMGSKDVFQLAREKAQAILENEPENTLLPEVVSKISGLL